MQYLIYSLKLIVFNYALGSLFIMYTGLKLIRSEPCIKILRQLLE